MTGNEAMLQLVPWLPHFVVVLLRVTGLFLFVPIFGSNMIPLRIRASIAVVMALAFAPLIPPITVPLTDPLAWVVLGIREFSVGFVLGLSAKMILVGIEGAAGLIAGQSGFALASMVDPMSGDQALAPAIFQNLIALILVLAANLHHLFIVAVIASYRLLPPVPAMPETDGLGEVGLMLGARLFGVAIQFAGPALIVTVAVDLVVALVGRAMPQIPILIVAYPFKMAAGLMAMALLARTVGAGMGWIGRTLESDGAQVIGALVAR